MKVINKNDITMIDDMDYRCKVYRILNDLLMNDNLIHNIVLSIDETELTNEIMATIQFCLTDNNPPYSLRDEGYYISFYHKEKSFWEKHIFRIREYYKYTYYVKRDGNE